MIFYYPTKDSSAANVLNENHIHKAQKRKL